MNAAPHPLLEDVGRLRTRMGAAFVGERAVFRGHDLHGDFKDMDWVGLYVFGITGRHHTPEQLRLLHAIWVYTSYPDARIWNNRVEALAGTTRSSGNLGASAALAVSEASIYGRGIDMRAARFLTSGAARLRSGGNLADCVEEELKRHRGIAGYGRPIASGDERMVPMLSLVARLKLDGGPHLQFAKDVERHLLEGRWRWRMNYAALAAALTADLGFTPREHYLFCFPAFLAGMQPCFIEASEEPAGARFPLPCNHVAYEGPARRSWLTNDPQR